MCSPVRASRAFVEGVIGLLRRRNGAFGPGQSEEVHDHAILVDDRRLRPAAVAGDLAELLVQRVLPDHLAVRRVAAEDAADRVQINAAGLRIADHAGPAHAGSRNIRLEHVELVPPQDLARGGVQADHLVPSVRQLLRVIHVVRGAAVQINSPVHDDRCGASADRRHPQNVPVALQRPVVDQPLLARDPVHLGTAPLCPVAGQRHAADQRQHHRPTHCSCLHRLPLANV